MGFKFRDWGTTATRGRKPKGEIVCCAVYEDKSTRDRMAEQHRDMRRKFGDGRVVTTGERNIRFDTVDVTTYLLTVRQPAPAA